MLTLQKQEQCTLESQHITEECFKLCISRSYLFSQNDKNPADS